MGSTVEMMEPLGPTAKWMVVVVAEVVVAEAAGDVAAGEVAT